MKKFYESRWLLIIILTILYVFLKYNELGGITVNIISVGMSAIILTLPLREKIYSLFFFLPLYLYIYVFSFAFYNVITILILLNMIYKKDKFNLKVLILTLFVLVYEMIFYAVNDNMNFTYLFKWIISFFLSFTLMYKSEINYDKCKTSFLICLGTSILGIATIIQYGSFIVDSSLREILGGGLSSLDQNTFSFYCLFSFVCGMYVYLDKDIKNSSEFYKKPLIKYILLILTIICFISGALMVSKTYFLVTILWGILVFLIFIRNPRKLLIYSVCIIVTGILFISIPPTASLIGNILERFGDLSNINDVTTGRLNIFIEYIKALSEHPFNLFFGAGLFTYNGFYNIKYISASGSAMVTHNIILEIICGYGLIGFLILTTIYFKIFKNNFHLKTNRNYSSILPLIIFIIFAQSLAIYREDVTHFIILLCFILIKPSLKMTKSNKLINKGGAYHDRT